MSTYAEMTKPLDIKLYDYFELRGYFEELVEVDSGVIVGTVNVEKPRTDRLGFYGRFKETLRAGQTIMVNKAHKGNIQVILKRDLEVWVTTHAICGPMKNPVHMVPPPRLVK